EGVETESQLEAVRALGCDAAQGYLLARPVRGEDLPSAIERACRAVAP
ncbi:MAG: EAL domain-containing protein, partial [Acidimicrobiales bacterium]